MPLDDRSYVRGEHPAACTCVACVAKRSGHRVGRQVWRGRDITPESDSRSGRSVRRGRDITPKLEPQLGRQGRLKLVPAAGSKSRRSRGKLFSLIAVAAFVIPVWSGWVVWQDYEKHHSFEPNRASQVVIA